MKKSPSRRILLLLLIVGFSFATNFAWARLPKPVKAKGVVVAIDLETQTLVFKGPKGKKPFLLDWNKETEFSTNGKPASAKGLKQGTSVIIFYKDVSFHNPLLKKVIWDDIVEGK